MTIKPYHDWSHLFGNTLKRNTKIKNSRNTIQMKYKTRDEKRNRWSCGDIWRGKNDRKEQREMRKEHTLRNSWSERRISLGLTWCYWLRTLEYAYLTVSGSILSGVSVTSCQLELVWINGVSWPIVEEARTMSIFHLIDVLSLYIYAIIGLFVLIVYTHTIKEAPSKFLYGHKTSLF